MTPPRTTPAGKYVAHITHAQEVTLRGSADLSFWKERLRGEGLHPAAIDGKAQILISSVAARFLGVAFRELSLSVFVCREEGGGTQDGVYLVHAFHSSRLFAFIERTLFATPYHPAAVAVDARLPASCQVSRGGGLLLRGEMAGGADRQPSRRGEECWEVPIFLPGSKPGAQEQAKVFFARLAGDTHAYPFLAEDGVTLKPTATDSAVQWLVDSHFAGQEWIIRPDATHARSKTVRRSPAEVFAQSAARTARA